VIAVSKDPAHSKAHVASAQHHGAGHEHEEFLASIRKLKEAENSSKEAIEQAKREAAGIEAAAKEKAVEIAAKASDNAVEAKNQMLKEWREKTDREISEIIGEAKKQAGKIREKRLAEREVEAISRSVISRSAI